MDQDRRLATTAEDFAAQAHREQRYNDGPYTAHLATVVHVLRDYGFDDRYVAAGWLHDTVEDTEVSVGDIDALFGPWVAEVVWACTGEGGDRKEHMAAIYAKIAATPEAAVVKLADRIANVEAAEVGSRHRERYVAEQAGFETAVRHNVPAAMWDRLERALQA